MNIFGNLLRDAISCWNSRVSGGWIRTVVLSGVIAGGAIILASMFLNGESWSPGMFWGRLAIVSMVGGLAGAYLRLGTVISRRLAIPQSGGRKLAWHCAALLYALSLVPCALLMCYGVYRCM
jgi:hypothetical protein